MLIILVCWTVNVNMSSLCGRCGWLHARIHFAYFCSDPWLNWAPIPSVNHEWGCRLRWMLLKWAVLPVVVWLHGIRFLPLSFFIIFPICVDPPWNMEQMTFADNCWHALWLQSQGWMKRNAIHGTHFQSLWFGPCGPLASKKRQSNTVILWLFWKG